MKLIVGLGNPGDKYAKTRHNYGFMVLDKLCAKHDGKFINDKRFKAEICQIFIDGEKVYLAKPQTFMNESGDSARDILSYFDVSIDRLWVVYDDVDIELGSVRVREEGSSGGHKGVQSIIDHVGSNKFARFRMGINSKYCDELTADEVVLRNFEKDEIPLVEQGIQKAIELIEKSLKDGIDNVSV